MCEISPVVPDWGREQKQMLAWQPSRALLAALRDYRQYSGSINPVRLLQKHWAVLRHCFWSVLTGSEISIHTSIGGGLLIPHPNGVVIHHDAQIGPNCLIFQQVTIGTRGRPGAPRIGGHVDIGAGAKILGDVTIGDDAGIGANAVVLCDVPGNSIAVGVPAIVKPRKMADA